MFEVRHPLNSIEEETLSEHSDINKAREALDAHAYTLALNLQGDFILSIFNKDSDKYEVIETFSGKGVV